MHHTLIEQAGFVTEERDGRMVGFFHGTGHGLGLDVHEYPGVGKASYELKAGHVVTVEPGTGPVGRIIGPVLSNSK